MQEVEPCSVADWIRQFSGFRNQTHKRERTPYVLIHLCNGGYDPLPPSSHRKLLHAESGCWSTLTGRVSRTGIFSFLFCLVMLQNWAWETCWYLGCWRGNYLPCIALCAHLELLVIMIVCSRSYLHWGSLGGILFCLLKTPHAVWEGGNKTEGHIVSPS